MANKKDIQQLFNQVCTISKTYDLIAKNTGENFNLFQILGMETAEVKTHSKFLAELLNPKGSHLQGDVFLKLFINYLNTINLLEENNQIKLKAENSNIKIEKYIGKKTETEGGRIDITIEEGKKHLICIENKIYAGEQDKQMLRYSNFGNTFETKHLFFLTLWGNDTNTNGEAKVYPISYKTHIVEWLELCKKEAVNLPILRESIGQYINLIKKLTHQTSNKNMANDLQKIILENYNESSIIANNFVKAQLTLFDNILKKVVEQVRPFIEKNNWIIDRVESIKNEKSGGGIYFKPNLYQEEEWKVGICGFNPFVGHIEFQKRIFIGVWGRDRKEDYKERYLSSKNKNFNIGWWNDYIFISDNDNVEFKLTNPELIEKLLDDKFLNRFVEHIVKEFENYFSKHKNNFEQMINDIQKANN